MHGNLPALEAVLREVDAIEADLVLVGGDVVSGGQPRETLERLLSLGDRARFIRGNADREVTESVMAPKSDDAIAVAQHWVARRLSQEQIDFLAALPLTTMVDVDGLGPVLFCHATPQDDEAIFTRATPAERVRELVGSIEQHVVVCGHTHAQFDRLVDEVRVVNAGSVGLPYEGRRGAFWAVLGPDVQHRRTDYDVEAAVEAVRAPGLGDDGQWFARYLLEPPTSEEVAEAFERMARGES